MRNPFIIIAVQFQRDDTTLVGTLVPKMSKYLPVVPSHSREYFYPYKCFRLACERMFGTVPCAVQYSSSIPEKEFDNDSEEDMILTTVMVMVCLHWRRPRQRPIEKWLVQNCMEVSILLQRPM